MNRRNFLKALGIGAAALVVPKLLVTPEDEEFQQVARRYWQGTGPLGPSPYGYGERIDNWRIEFTMHPQPIRSGDGKNDVFSRDALIAVRYDVMENAAAYRQDAAFLSRFTDRSVLRTA